MNSELGPSGRAEELLAHGDFVRRLARSLVRDPHLAADVAQDALVAGITQPRPRGSLRAWLTGVVRNRARMEFRAAARRERRELAASRPASVPTSDVVARLDVERRLVEAVARLDEPYRSSIVMRFFDDLAPAEIARRTGVPVETVRTRLRRALEQLRARLDASSSRGRAAWVVALAPVLARGPGSGPGPSWVGGTAMATNTKLTIAAALLVGGLVGAAGRELVREAPSAAGPGPAQASADGAGGSRGVASARTRPMDRRSADGPSNAEGSKLVLDLAVAPVTAGRGSVRGRVATADGAPVAGVVVVAERPVDSEFQFPTSDVRLGFAEWATETVREEARRRSREATAMSGDDGTFEVGGLGDAPYRLTASHASYEIEAAGGNDGRWVRAGETLGFLAVPVAQLRIDVVGPDGAPVDEAVLVVAPAGTDKSTRRPWTPERPHAALRSGVWSIEADARNGELRSALVRIDVAPPATPAAVTLRLAESLGIRGRVLHAPVGENGFAFVRMLPLGPEDSVEEIAARLVADGRNAVVFGAFDMRYRFDGVDPGRYLLGVSNMAGAVLATKVVTLGDASVWQDLDVPEPDDASFLRVRVLLPDGTAAADADLQLTMGTFVPGRGFPSKDVVRVADGEFRVRRKSVAEAVPGAPSTRIVVRVPNLGRRDVLFDDKAASPIEVRFQSAAALDVAVSRGSADPRSLAFTLVPVGADGRADERAGGEERRTPGASGVLPWPDLQPGDYELSTLLVRGSLERRLAARRVTVRAGTDRVSVDVPPLKSLTIELEGATGKEVVLLSSMAGGPLAKPEQAPVGDDGRAVFDLLPPGRYEVRTTLGGRPCFATVDVPGDSVVRLRPSAVGDSER